MSRKTKPGIKSLGWTENCIFCGNPADSEEDAHPKWLMDWLKKNMCIDPTDAHPQRLPILERQVTVGGEVQAYEYEGEFKVGVMCVCEKCNNGWMSLIQRDHGQRVLTRLLEEPYPILETADCRSLALWVVMTSMVLDALNNGPKYRQFAEVERCVFWKDRWNPRQHLHLDRAMVKLARPFLRDTSPDWRKRMPKWYCLHVRIWNGRHASRQDHRRSPPSSTPRTLGRDVASGLSGGWMPVHLSAPSGDQRRRWN